MSYHKLLGLEKEPFSTSPDPDFLYLTREHEIALTNLLIELRLKRGLSVIFGDIGTGKTTLSRKLVQELRSRGDMIFHIILNPSFDSEEQFLQSIIRNLNIKMPSQPMGKVYDKMEMRDAIERFLMTKVLDEKRTVVLVVDEAQKLEPHTLETLRILLNFETNEHKLLQLVLLGQLELYSKVVNMANFLDRVSFKYTLNPLTVEDTAAMIEYRLQTAGLKNKKTLFLDEAIHEVFCHTGGYPRRINMICHQILKELTVKGADIIDKELVQEIVDRQQTFSRTEVSNDFAQAQSFFSDQSAIN